LANFFTLELDTTGPEIAVTAPAYTIPEIETEMTVQATEQLGTYQEFYLIDAAGARHDLIFEHVGDAYRGVHNFSGVALGICTLYARVKDEVDNWSPLRSTTIHIRQPAPLILDILDFTIQPRSWTELRQLDICEAVIQPMLQIQTRPMATGEQTRKMEVRAK
jgi:hypothetical protein